MTKLFISYSRRDIDFAQKLTESLDGQDLDFWIHWEGIPPTVGWWKEFEKGIEEAGNFLLLLSPDSIDSEVCKQEIEHALKNGKRLIIRDIKAEEAPAELGHLNWIFFRENDDFSKSFEKLIAANNTDYEWVQIHRRLQMRALEWERGNRDNSFLLCGTDLHEAEAQLVANAGKIPKATALQTEYVLSSRQVTDRQRRITNGIATSGVIILAALAVFGFVQANLATDNATEAQSPAATAQAASTLAVANETQRQTNIARAGELATYSEQVRDSNFPLSLLLSIEAERRAKKFRTKVNILQKVQTNPQLIRYLFGHSDYVHSVAFCADCEILASGIGMAPSSCYLSSSVFVCWE